MSSSWNKHWPLERVLFALAGTVTLTSVLLAATISSWFLLLTAFAGVNQWLYVTVGACPASLVLQRFLGIKGCGFARLDDVTSGPTRRTPAGRTIAS
jgi:hypothetical protein